MLREFQIHRATDMNYFTDGDDDEVLFWKDGAPDDQPLIIEQLSSDQQQQLQQLLSKFNQVLCNQPGQIQLTEHKIDTGSARPVRCSLC